MEGIGGGGRGESFGQSAFHMATAGPAGAGQGQASPAPAIARRDLKSLPQPEPIVVAARVRPEVRAVKRVRAEDGYPYADAEQIAALRLEDAERASITPLVDPDQPIRTCTLLMPTEARRAILMCRNARLGAGCPGAMRQLPEEIWQRIFGVARTTSQAANAVELGPPPGSNATMGVINEPTPLEEPPTADPPSRRYACGLAFGPAASQDEVYEYMGAELLQSAFEGYPAAILACALRAWRSPSSHTHTHTRARARARTQARGHTHARMPATASANASTIGAGGAAANRRLAASPARSRFSTRAIFRALPSRRVRRRPSRLRQNVHHRGR